MTKNQKKMILIIFAYVLLFLFFFPVALIVGTIHLFVHIKRSVKNLKISVRRETIAKKEVESVQCPEPPKKKTKKKAVQGPRYCTYTIPEVRSISRYEKSNSNTAPSKKYFSEDELFEIDYLLGSSDNLFDDGYDITDEEFQNNFKKAKSGLYETVTIDTTQRYSILKKGETYYFAALSGCTCKKFENEGFCEHVVINAINQKLIDPINGIRHDDFVLREKLNFVNEYIIGSHGNILKVEPGFIKESKVPAYFMEKGFFELSSGIEQLISYLSKRQINELIPNLKIELKNIDPEIKLGTLKVSDLKKLIVNNKHVFEKYFRGYVYLKIKEDVENMIFDCEDLAKWIIYTNKKYR